MKKCLKCKSLDLVVTELANVGMRYEQTVAGQWRRVAEGDPLETAYVYAVECRCRTCNHEWRLRKNPLAGPWASDDGWDEDPSINPENRPLTPEELI